VFVNQPSPFLATVSTNPSVGELVYELMAVDPDTGSDIKYILESGKNSSNVTTDCLVRELDNRLYVS